MSSILIITGQTASGKTDLAFKKALELSTDIFNVDSRQIYKDLSIVTGKDLPTGSVFVTVEKRENVVIGYYDCPNPHNPAVHTKLWLYDILNVDKSFSSYAFEEIILPILSQYIANGKTPILVGGTFFYIYQLLYLTNTGGVEIDWEKRNQLSKHSVPELQALLVKQNPKLFESLNNSDRNNPQRLIRKLEIGESISSLTEYQNQNKELVLPQKLHIENIQIEFIAFAHLSKEMLHKKIADRVALRIEQGAIDEVKKLIAAGYSENDPGFTSTACSDIIGFINEKISKEELISRWITSEMQYAKRQLTLMKKFIKSEYWVEIS